MTWSGRTNCLAMAMPAGIDRPKQQADNMAMPNVTNTSTGPMKISTENSPSSTALTTLQPRMSRLRSTRSARMPPQNAIRAFASSWADPTAPA